MMESFVKFLATGLGGALGAVVRLCSVIICKDVAIDILLCNLLGAFMLSIAKTLFFRTHKHFEKFIAVGFCGGLSTFPGIFRYSESSFFQGDRVESMLFICANFLFCYIALELGRFFARKLLKFKKTEEVK